MNANQRKWMVVATLASALAAGCGDDDDVMPGVDSGTPVDMNVANDMNEGVDMSAPADLGPAADLGGDVDAGTAPTCPDVSARIPVDIGGEITGQTWTCDNLYRLTATTFVTSGTLTIEPGTIIVGAVGNAALVITKNATIDAQGTAALPIRFSSAKEYDGDTGTVPAAGDWGGLVLLGKARINVVGGTTTIEGLPATDTGGAYGGTDDAHDCGTVRYVTIRYAGFIFGTANELNSLSVGACGSATTLDYIETRDGLDDGVEFFGGTANISHALIVNTGDDSFDYDLGYTGKVQFFLAEQRGAAGEDRGIEGDNNGDSMDATPRSAPEFWNATFIGVGHTTGTGQNAALLREGTAIRLHNSIFMEYPAVAIRIQHAPTDAQIVAGTLNLQNMIFFNLGPDGTGTVACDVGSTACAPILADTSNRTTDPGVSAGHWQPAPAAAAATGGATPPSGGFFDASATYVGAVAPTGTPWYAGWRTAD
jgi:hypothetical protein